MFKTGDSTVNTALRILHTVRDFNNHHYDGVRLFSLDLSKAFDRLLHQVIINQIKQINPGVNTHVVIWLKSFLSDRVQIVSYQNELSKPASINQGVPQGTVLGPPSFNMSFDDLKCLYENACLVKFADDIIR